jgi:hypothetical protein
MAWGHGRLQSDGGQDVQTTQAFALKARADAAMDTGSYGIALRDYREAYALSSRPALLYNMGRACQKLGQYEEALGYLERFARTAPADVRARVPRLPQLIAEVKGHLAAIDVTSPVVGARVLVRGAWVGVTPMRAAVAVLPGRASVRIVADGYAPMERDVVLVAGQTHRVNAALVPAAPSPTTLTVRSSMEHADVCIDTRCLGPAPIVAPLAAGTHTVVLRTAHGSPIETTTELSPGQHKELWVQTEEPGGLTTKWWFWTGVGAIVAGSVALTATLLAAPGGRSEAGGAR